LKELEPEDDATTKVLIHITLFLSLSHCRLMKFHLLHYCIFTTPLMHTVATCYFYYPHDFHLFIFAKFIQKSVQNE